MVILISGISSGFGLAMAKALSAQGHTVYGTVRKEVEQIPNVHYLFADVTNEEQVQAAVETVVREQGAIDIFINNAGTGIGGPIELSTTEEAQWLMDTNFFGLVRFCRSILPVMRNQGRGRIIAISSIGGQVGLPYQGFYSASKFAIEGYCESLRLEVKPFGIDVVLINPGDFATGFTAARRKISEEEARIYPSFASSMKGIEKDENGGLKPEVLASRICRIVTAKHPKHRYTVSTFIQGLAVTAKKILPSKLFAWIMSLYYGVK